MDLRASIGPFYESIAPAGCSRRGNDGLDGRRRRGGAAPRRGRRSGAEARPLKLPVNRRVDESHHLVTDDGLGVWFTIQISPHARIQEALFERGDRPPSDGATEAWPAAATGG